MLRVLANSGVAVTLVIRFLLIPLVVDVVAVAVVAPFVNVVEATIRGQKVGNDGVLCCCGVCKGRKNIGENVNFPFNVVGTG